MSSPAVKVGTRSSQLAMWQAHHVQDLLESAGHSVDVKGILTTGDKDQIKPLSGFASKGVFTKELDIALMDGRVDIAVHCVKDLPTTLPDGLIIAAVLPRGSREDVALIRADHKANGFTSLSQLPEGSVIGTSAVRRKALITQHYGHLTCQDIRGNINTRMKKLEEKQYDAILLAKTGLERLKMNSKIDETLDMQAFGYAVGQGALAIVTREDDAKMRQLVGGLSHEETAMQVAAERALLRTLNGGCSVPISVLVTAAVNENKGYDISLRAEVRSLDGKEGLQDTSTVTVGSLAEADAMGQKLGETLLTAGAAKLLTPPVAEPATAVNTTN